MSGVGLLVHGQEAPFHREDVLLKIHVISGAILLVHRLSAVALGYAPVVSGVEASNPIMANQKRPQLGVAAWSTKIPRV